MDPLTEEEYHKRFKHIKERTIKLNNKNKVLHFLVDEDNKLFFENEQVVLDIESDYNTVYNGDPYRLLLRKKIKELKEIWKDITDSIMDIEIAEKIKWNCSPAILGYLFNELVKQNFISPPLYNGETNLTGLAKLCWKYFETNTDSKEYFEKQFRDSSLSETKRNKFNIPSLKDLD
jgi:hypothetical protein